MLFLFYFYFPTPNSVDQNRDLFSESVPGMCTQVSGGQRHWEERGKGIKATRRAIWRGEESFLVIFEALIYCHSQELILAGGAWDEGRKRNNMTITHLVAGTAAGT